MTRETEELTRDVRRRGNRRILLAAAAVIAVIVVVEWQLSSMRSDLETSRSNNANAVASADQLCAQVRQLGGTCVVDPQSLRGEPGPEGPPGPVGPPGLDGQNGAQDTDGATGAPGPTGPAGPAGATGADGTQGETGSTGPQGPAGPAGPAGPVCPDGWHMSAVTVLAEGGPREITTCVRDEEKP